MTKEEKNKKPPGPVVWLVPLVVGLGLTAVYFTGVGGKSPTIIVTEPEEHAPQVVERGGEKTETLVVEPEEHTTQAAERGGEKPEMLVLTPQQLAQANEMLAAFQGKPLNELIQVYGVMQMAAVSVSPEDRPVFEFVLAKLGVYIAELER